MSSGTETVKIELITPERAAKLLERNKSNRRIREGRVREIARAITAGHWYVTGDTIKINGDGSLLDGQHRLSAIVAAGVPVRIAVARGVDSVAQRAMDRTLSRTLGDDLRMAGHAHYNMLAAACGLRMRWDDGSRSGGSFGVTRASLDDANDVLQRVPHFERSVAMCADHRLTKLVQGSVAAMCHSVWYEIDPRLADAFIEDFASGVGLKKRDPVLAVREKLIEARAAHVKYRVGDLIAILMRAWNARIEGREMLKVYRYGGGKRARGQQNIPEPTTAKRAA